jgi:predicted LPLAT superfamily acyltransferase
MRLGLHFDCEFENSAAVEDLIRNEEVGLVLLTSHFGCWQAMVSELGNYRRRVNILVAPERNEEVRRVLAVHGEAGSGLDVISNRDPAGGMVEVAAALDRGEVVCMMGDRCVEEEGVEVPFLGAMARFPVAAFHVASMVDCRVVPVFMVRDGGHRKFRIRYGDPIAPKRTRRSGRREAMAQSVRQYVAELEKMTNRYPYQCFVLQDVWRGGRGRSSGA